MESSTVSSNNLQKELRMKKIENSMKLKLDQYIQYYKFRQRQIQNNHEINNKSPEAAQDLLDNNKQIYELITFHQNDMKDYYMTQYGNYAISLYYQKTRKMRIINQIVRTKFSQQKKSKEQINKFVFHLYLKYLRIQMNTDYKSSNFIISLKYMSGFKPYKKINRKIIKKLFLNQNFKDTFQTFIEEYLDLLLKQQKEYQIQKLYYKLQMTPESQIAHQLESYKLHFPWKQSLINRTIKSGYEILKQSKQQISFQNQQLCQL